MNHTLIRYLYHNSNMNLGYIQLILCSEESYLYEQSACPYSCSLYLQIHTTKAKGDLNDKLFHKQPARSNSEANPEQ
jgi:hypothetical protein